MKSIQLFVIHFFCAITINAVNSGYFVDATDFFKEHVNSSGFVDYKDIYDHRKSLNKLVELIKEMKIDNFDKKGEKAFLINAYNILVIKSVINNYPVDSPKDIPGFFDNREHTIGDNNLTLNDLENAIREKFNDPRIHFALVCAAKGCPVLLQRAYLPEQVNKQLEEKTKKTLNDEDFVRVDHIENTVRVSKIFKWYKKDFLINSSSIIDYLNKYRRGKVALDYSVAYYEYDWSLNRAEDKPLSLFKSSSRSNIYTYTPSTLLSKGEIELQLYNNLYTQTAWRDKSGIRRELNRRANYFTGMFQIVYGISESERVNIGLDVNLRSVRNDPDPNSSAFETLLFENRSFSRTTVSTIGPKVKFVPFKQIEGLSVQSSFWFPVSANMESDPWLYYDRYISWNRIFYDKTFSGEFQLFTEADLLMRFAKGFNLNETITEIPVSVFFSYFPNSKIVLFAMSQYAPTVTESSTYYIQSGIGMKYQLFPAVNIEAMYSNFWASANKGAGETFNLGIRYLR